jgi:hypothetical protein
MQTYSSDHGNRFVWESSTNVGGTSEYGQSDDLTSRHFQAMSGYIINQKLLVCPQDTRSYSSNWESMRDANVSYFIGTDSKASLPSAIIMGDRNLRLSKVSVQNRMKNLARWDAGAGLHGDMGHVVFASGGVFFFNSDALAQALSNSPVENRFSIP